MADEQKDELEIKALYGSDEPLLHVGKGGKEGKDIESPPTPQSPIVENESEVEAGTGEDSSSPEEREGGGEKGEDESTLMARIVGLQKELSRVRKEKSTSSREVQELRDRLAQVQGLLEGLKSKEKEGTTTNPLAKYSDDDLVQGQLEWEDALFDARDSLRQARADGDKAAESRATQAINVAQRTLRAIRKEILDRTKQASASEVQAQTTKQRLQKELTDLYDAARGSFPELDDPESDLWQAAKREFDSHKDLMGALGPLGDLMAVSMAVVKNPALVKGAERRARKELVEEINTKVEKSLLKHGGKPSQKSTPDYSKMSAAEFDSLIEKIKLGM